MSNRFANKRLLVILPVILIASLFVASQALPRAHAQFTGLVCITASTTATSCPTGAPALGPFTVGQNFSVGVFISGSDAMGGFDIFVAANPAFVSPQSAALGPLIVTPTLTSICVNGLAQTGSCTVGAANGPGVVEVTTLESTGNNECGGISPCSGMAFTILYKVVAATASTPLTYPTAGGCSTSSVASPPNECVLVDDNTGSTLPENIQGATVTQNVATSHPTTTTVSCAPASVTVGTATSCTATVTDTSATGATNPTGSVAFTSSGTGAFSPAASCTLANSGTNAATCPASYTPSAVGTGTHNIIGMYGGDSTHSKSNSTAFALTVTKASPTFTTALSANTITIGGSVTDTATVSGGFNPTGTITYNAYTNTACTSASVFASVVPIGSPSAAFTPASAGTYFFRVAYLGDANNNPFTTACGAAGETLTVSQATPAVSTAVTPSSITVGAQVTVSASLTGGYPSTGVTGTVTYSRFTVSGCTGTGTAIATVTVGTGNSVPSTTDTPATAGSYSYQAKYNGDGNNTAAVGTCANLTVNKVTTTITTAVSPATITIGASATDLATVTGSSPTGTVTYNAYATSTCTTSVFTSTVAVGAASAAFTPASAGTYFFTAAYSGDANNLAATSACGATGETLTVNKASPTIATSLSATTITVGQSVTDSSTLSSFFQAGGTVTYNLFVGSSTCTGTGSTVSTVTVTNGIVPSSRSVMFNATNAGGYSFHAVYSGDANNNGATSACEPLTVNPSTGAVISTTLSATSIAVGGSVSDSATLTGVTSTAGGTVTYNLFSSSTCTGTATVISTVTVTNGIVPNSASHTFSSAGAFGWNAVYSGDANNAGATSTCEPLTVNKASPTIATSLSATTITIGGSVTDSATLTGFFQAGGSVTYNEFSGATCAGTATVVSTVTVTNGVVPNSAAVTPTTAGSYSFNAVYTGDANNNGATSTCEPLTVNKASPTIATSLSATTITVGQSVTDSATLTSFFQAGGTATYRLFVGSSTCTGTGSTVSTVTVTNGVVPSSRSVMFNATNAGGYSFNAVYSGDANNNGATSACEPLTVNAASGVTVSTSLSATAITVGGSASDSAALHGATATAGGTVTYNVFTSSTCTGTATVVSTVTVTNGVVPNSAAHTFNTAGAYGWNAVYSGDANNGGATSTCEPFTVNKATPTIATALSATTITVGSSVTDSATLTGSFQAGGSVTYNEFSGAACAGTATVVSTVTVTNGVVPNSAAVTPTPAGSYSFNAVYSGDTNNAVATSACEPLTVNKASPAIATSLSATTITIGGSVTDSATLTSFFQAGGSVTYNEFSGAACAGTATVVSTVTVTNGVVPNSAAVTPTAPGSYSFNAVYTGDANNNGATSACEPLTVNKASPTIATTVTPATINVGGSATDLATLSNGFNPTGTVTYTAYSDTACTVSVFTDTEPVGTASKAFTPTATGTYRFIASYSGDANNNAATGTCGAPGETLTVGQKPTPTVTSTVTPSSITIGGSASDLATVTGGASPTGTVTYTAYSNAACTTSVFTDTEPLGTASKAFTPTAPGTYNFIAAYSGDANNNPASTACGATGETLTVNKASVSITTSVSPASITIGGSATDTATLTGGFSPTGTVTYTAYSDTACTVSVFTSTVPVGSASAAFTPSTTGTYRFVASYSGDANNNPSTTACGASGETLTVTNATPTITSTVTPASITIGGSASDLATVSGGHSPTGTVTYTAYSNAACTTSVFTDTEPLGTASKPFTPAAPGTYNFIAAYNGDANNGAASTACGATGETLTVNKASVSITTTVSSTSVPAGSSVTDQAHLTGGYPSTGVSGTVTYFLYSNSGCTGTGTAEGTVTVGAGNSVGPSNTVTPAAGSYSFNAVYSSDANNNGATSACEPFTVNDFSLTAASTTLTVNAGSSGSDTLTATSLGGFTGSITLTNSSVPAGVSVTFVPNPVTIATAGGSATSNLQLSVAAGTSAQTFTLVVTGTSGSQSHQVSITVTITTGASPTLTKLNWDHDLSLPSVQSWKAFVSNPQTNNVNVVVRIVGRSATNPSLTFDIVCGKTCVNTVGGSPSSTPGLTPVTIKGLSTSKFRFDYALSPAFAGQTVKFTATLYWNTGGTSYAASNSIAGTFFVE